MLWKSNSGRTWSLFLFRRLKKKKKNESMLRGHSIGSNVLFTDITSTNQSINQSIGIRRLFRSVDVGCSACVRQTPSCRACGQSSWRYKAKVLGKQGQSMCPAPPRHQLRRDTTNGSQHSFPRTSDKPLGFFSPRAPDSYSQVTELACEMAP